MKYSIDAPKKENKTPPPTTIVQSPKLFQKVPLLIFAHIFHFAEVLYFWEDFYNYT